MILVWINSDNWHYNVANFAAHYPHLVTPVFCTDTHTKAQQYGFKIDDEYTYSLFLLAWNPKHGQVIKVPDSQNKRYIVEGKCRFEPDRSVIHHLDS